MTDLNQNHGGDSRPKTALPLLDCHGCGVCCLHMGYPAFNLSNQQLEKVALGEKLSATEIEELGPAASADLTRWEQMPEELRADLLETILAYTPPAKGELDQACIWLHPDTRLCMHHKSRPQVCRDFEIGCQQCLDWRSHYHEEVL